MAARAGRTQAIKNCAVLTKVDMSVHEHVEGRIGAILWRQYIIFPLGKRPGCYTCSLHVCSCGASVAYNRSEVISAEWPHDFNIWVLYERMGTQSLGVLPVSDEAYPVDVLRCTILIVLAFIDVREGWERVADR